MNRFSTYFGNISFVLPVAFAAMAGPMRAVAQEIPCAPTGVIEQHLTDEYGESLRAEREAPVPGGTAYLWTNGLAGTYSVLINPEPGLTCAIDSGQSDSLKELSA